MLISSQVLNGINGIAKIPGDKSISHRSIIISSIANGISLITNILKSTDVINTINAFKLMGVQIEETEHNIKIYGKGLNSLLKPDKNIYLGNSGTSARLLVGLLSAQNFNTCLIGDNSLSKRPMARIIDPLVKMGAHITSNNYKLPLSINGKQLNSIRYLSEVPSAQVKSGIMLAALFTKNKTEIIEKKITRNHTEIMLKSFNADIEIKKKERQNHIFINGQKELSPNNINIPSDLSSAAFFIVAALINKNSYVEMKNININPTRDGILKALDLMGGKLIIKNKKNINGEIVGDIIAKSTKLNGCELDDEMAKLMIDEYPILSIAASFANSPSIFRGLGELKIKESNRLDLIRYKLDNCGIFCKIKGDDLLIDPTKKISPKQNIIITDCDHRIAMAFVIMGTKLGIDLKIKDSEYIATSFPKFINVFNSIGGKLTE